MKFIFLLLLLILIRGDTLETESFDMKVVVTNINTLKGTIEMGVFNDSKNFLQKGKEYQTYSNEVSSDTMIFLLKGFKKDQYAFSLYHDVNSDKECNLNFLGIPKEPYGFSKNYRPILSKPTFDDCKINASQDMSIGIELLD